MDYSFAKSDRLTIRRKKREEAMRDAQALLKSLGVRFSQPDPHMLRFGDYSYWPGTKRLYKEDDESSSKLQGLDELAKIIQSFRRPSKHQTSETTPKRNSTIVHLSEVHRK
jgi:hypothetical protein